jgi:cysteine desulfurase
MSEAPGRRIYLDNLAAAPCVPEAAAAVTDTLDKYPGSLRSAGICSREAASFLDTKAGELAEMSGAGSVRFTAGGSDANLFAVIGMGRRMLGAGRTRIVSTGVEHCSVMTALRRLESEGCGIDWLSTGEDGRIDPSELRELIGPGTGLVTVRHGHPVTGITQPVEEISGITAEKGVHLHLDCCSTAGRIGTGIVLTDVCSASVSGRAAGGGPGAGALLGGDSLEMMEPMYPGSVCQPGLPAVAGMMAALGTATKEMEARGRMAGDLLTEVLDGLDRRGIRYEIAGGAVPGIPGACLLKLAGRVPPLLHAELERAGVIVSCPVSSERLACLQEMGQDTSEPGRYIGFCLSHSNTILDAEYFLEVMTEILK